MTDVWVQTAQLWLNETYAGVPGFTVVEPNGQTGWPTMFALTRALQIELGITSLSDTFGPTTSARFESQVGSITASTANRRIVQILMCALWCKGYPGGDIRSGKYTEDLAASCSSVKNDMGMGPAGPAITVKIMKSILTMDAYVLVRRGRADVRAAQQWLNGTYLARRDWAVIPCDGVFSRDVQKGLMFALQYELGMADGTANGSFGPATQAGLKASATVQPGSVDGPRRFVRLFQCALTFLRYSVPLDGSFGISTTSAVLEFQEFSQLPATGVGNYTTWASLLVSTGDPDRPGTASDTNVSLTATTAAALRSAGYVTVGRYLNGVTKRILPSEIVRIHQAGMEFFPIFQEFNNDAKYFTEEIGFRHGSAAVRRARLLGIKPGAIIWFPVDWDATDWDIDAIVLPWFEQVRRGVNLARENEFRIGVYGPRNVCQRVCDAGLAESVFVGGISRGWSGNLGYPLPALWAYDQIQTLKLPLSDGTLIEIDKVIRSPRAESLGPQDVVRVPAVDDVYDVFYEYMTTLLYDAEAILEQSSVDFLVRGYRDDVVLHFLQAPKYWDVSWRAFTPLVEDLPTNEALSLALRPLRTSFHQTAAAPPPESAYEGDIAHLAATARGLMTHGSGAGSDVNFGDLGGWAVDLASFWAAYLAARSADHSLSFAAYCAQRLCTRAESYFGERDLVSDIDAYLIWRRILDGATVTDALREILVACQVDPTWRFRTFLEERFGGDVRNLHLATRHVFTAVPLSGFTLIKMDFARSPGELDFTGVVPDDEVALEWDILTDAFAKAILDRAGL